MTKRQGFTIAELLVSMTLFGILTSLVLVGFISIANVRARAGSMKDSQQKIRLVVDQIVRMSKEATSVTILAPDVSRTLDHPKDYILDLRYDNITKTTGTGGPARVRYIIHDMNSGGRASLKRVDYNCFFTKICDGITEEDIISRADEKGAVDLIMSDSLIEWLSPETSTDITGSFPLAIRIRLNGQIGGNAIYSDTFKIDTNVVLESIK